MSHSQLQTYKHILITKDKEDIYKLEGGKKQNKKQMSHHAYWFTAQLTLIQDNIHVQEQVFASHEACGKGLWLGFMHLSIHPELIN